MIGEFIGKNPHVVAYDKPELVFYSIVVHNSTDSCLAPAVAFQILKELGLPVVRHRSVIA